MRAGRTTLEGVRRVPEPPPPAGQAPVCPRARWGVGTTDCKTSVPRSGKQDPCSTKKSTETDPERTRAIQSTERKLERAPVNRAEDSQASVRRVARKTWVQVAPLGPQLRK